MFHVERRALCEIVQIFCVSAQLKLTDRQEGEVEMRADSKHRSVGDCVEPYDTQQSKDVKYRWKLLKKKPPP